MKDHVNVGDHVEWRSWAGGLNSGFVRSIEITDFPREKHGKAVTSVTHSIIRKNRALFTAGTGEQLRWFYSDQILI